MKKKLICALMTAAMAGSLVSGLTVSADSDSQVTISLYTTLPNKDAQFEQLCEEFMEEKDVYKRQYIISVLIPFASRVSATSFNAVYVHPSLWGLPFIHST